MTRLRSTLQTVITSVLIGVAMTALGCVDTSAPKGVASITILTFPSPSVAVGDVLRDSLGAPTPLGPIAFDGLGNPIPNTTFTFVALDPSVAIDANGTVHGLAIDTLGARIVAGVGSLQTPIVRLVVTAKPENVVGGGTVAVLAFPATTAQSPLADSLTVSVPLTVTVTSLSSARGAQGIVVKYDVLSAPVPVNVSSPTTFIYDDGGKRSTRDTTDFKGVASRTVTLLHRRLGDAALVAGTVTDTIVVRATVQYAGTDVPGSPAIFKVPVARKP